MYMLSGIGFRAGSLADSRLIKSCFESCWPLPERRPATPQAARLGPSRERGSRAGLEDFYEWHIHPGRALAIGLIILWVSFQRLLPQIPEANGNR